ncbi:MAG TPA: nucleoside monophosphate kinase, partial [Ktedonobacteraceae bacterium]|nr:nucleoside monophosphate kinase [Ktedonobacteraceae bacterium]
LQQLNRQIDLVLYLKVSRGELMRRLAGRVFCRANAHIYNVELQPPKVPGVCDLDGSMLYQRSDDTGEAVRKRLVVFFYAADQLLEHYKKQNKLREVDGNLSIAEVQALITSEIKAYTGKS